MKIEGKKYCPECGCQSPLNTKFCIDCGNAFLPVNTQAQTISPNFIPNIEASPNSTPPQTDHLEKSSTQIQPVKTSEKDAQRVKILDVLKAQYDERLDDLEIFDIIEDKKNPQARRVDKGLLFNRPKGEYYRVPAWEQIKSAITPKKLDLVLQLETPLLLIVPWMFSVDDLRRAINYSAEKKKINNDHFKIDVEYNIGDGDQLLSDVKKVDVASHGGITRKELLKVSGEFGWEITIVDGDEQPPGFTWGNSAIYHLEDFSSKGFHGLSVQAYLVLRMCHLKSGLLTSNFKEKYSDGVWTSFQDWEWLLNAYLTKPHSPNESLAKKMVKRAVENVYVDRNYPVGLIAMGKVGEDRRKEKTITI